MDPQLFVWATFAVLTMAMAGSKVFSPQYLCWFLPAFLLVEPPCGWRAALAPLVFLLTCFLTTLVFPVLWGEVVRPISAEQNLFALPTLRVTLLLVGRNLLWVGFGVLAVLHMQRRGWAYPRVPQAPLLLAQPRGYRDPSWV